MVKKLLLLVCMIGTYLNAESVQATVNTQEVVRGNAVEFTIKASGASAAFPNIQKIQGLPVRNAGTSTSTNMRITSNGMQRETTTTKRYIFTPTHAMVIPSYSVRIGNKIFKTKPIEITVIKFTAPAMRSKSGYSFVMKSSKDTMVVGESCIVTLYLSLSDHLGVQQVSEYIEPSASAFFFKDLGKQKQYKHGTTNIIEKQYLITSKKEGNFTLSTASAKIGVTDRSRQDLFGRYGIRWIDVVSNALPLEVKALKTETDLVGDFTISSKIDTQKVKANKPVNLTVQIKGTGNLEEFEFPKYEIDGVTIYDDEAKIETHSDHGKLISTYSKKFVFIAEESFSIPKRTISVYSTSANKIKRLTIPHYEITIEKKKASATVLPVETKHIPTHTIEKTHKEKASIVSKESVSWWMLVVAFVLGLMAMYLGRFVPNIFKVKEKPYKESEALKILYAHISEDKTVEEMVHRLYARKNGDKSVTIDKKELKEMVNRFR